MWDCPPVEPRSPFPEEPGDHGPSEHLGDCQRQEYSHHPEPYPPRLFCLASFLTNGRCQLPDWNNKQAPWAVGLNGVSVPVPVPHPGCPHCPKRWHQPSSQGVSKRAP